MMQLGVILGLAIVPVFVSGAPNVYLNQVHVTNTDNDPNGATLQIAGHPDKGETLTGSIEVTVTIHGAAADDPDVSGTPKTVTMNRQTDASAWKGNFVGVQSYDEGSDLIDVALLSDENGGVEVTYGTETAVYCWGADIVTSGTPTQIGNSGVGTPVTCTKHLTVRDGFAAAVEDDTVVVGLVDIASPAGSEGDNMKHDSWVFITDSGDAATIAAPVGGTNTIGARTQAISEFKFESEEDDVPADDEEDEGNTPDAGDTTTTTTTTSSSSVSLLTSRSLLVGVAAGLAVFTA